MLTNADAALRISDGGGTGDSAVAIAAAGASTIDGTNDETVTGGTSQTITIGQVADGDSYQIDIGDLAINAADGNTATGERSFQYVAGANDGTGDVANNLANQINSFFESLPRRVSKLQRDSSKRQ